MNLRSLKIKSRCDSSWNSDILSGDFHAIGGTGRTVHDNTLYARTVYAKDTPDKHGRWWYFYFDGYSKLWKFWYSYQKPQTGNHKFLGKILSVSESVLLGQ